MSRRAKRKKGAADQPRPAQQPTQTADEPGRLGLAYICLLAFLAGASVMIVELSASRVLAPCFGNTLYTWTSLIGIILLALSVGYYAGGTLADRYPSPKLLLHLLAAAAIFVLLIPLLSSWVTGVLAPEGQEVDLVWGPLAAALLLFALPGCLLGTVTPFAVKLISLRSHNQRVGASAGIVAMLSTVGSVLGTFAAGFVFIPLLGIKAIFLLVGFTLAVAAALGYVLIKRLWPVAMLILTALALSAQVARTQEPADDVVFQTDSFYHRISVLRKKAPDGRGVTFLLTDGAAQGAQSDSDERLVYGYTKFYRLERLFCPSLRRAVFLGGGAYSMPQSLADDHPDAVVDVVELDPQIQRIGRRYFRLDDYKDRVRPVTGDARAFLAASNEQYDLIFGDVFRGRQTVPPHLASREFFDQVNRRLTDDGVYMMNLMGALEGPRSRLFRSMAATLRDVFPELYVFRVRSSVSTTQPQNLVLVAPKRALRLTRDELVALAKDDAVAEMAGKLVESYDLSAATIFTDDYCPVEYIAAKQLRE